MCCRKCLELVEVFGLVVQCIQARHGDLGVCPKWRLVGLQVLGCKRHHLFEKVNKNLVKIDLIGQEERFG